MLSGEIPTDVHESSGTLESTGIIEKSSSVIYKAAISITLKPGFKAEQV